MHKLLAVCLAYSVLSGLVEAGPLIGIGVCVTGAEVATGLIVSAGTWAGIAAAGIGLIAGPAAGIGYAAGAAVAANKKNDKDAAYKASVSASLVAALKASATKLGAPPAPKASSQANTVAHDTAIDPMTFGTRVTREAPTHGPLTTLNTHDNGLITLNATGWPIAPAGVPQFNVDECILDMRALVKNGGGISMFQPDNQPILIAKDVPRRCMNLVGLVVKPSTGMYISVEGTSSVKWNNLSPQQVKDIRAFFKSKM